MEPSFKIYFLIGLVFTAAVMLLLWRRNFPVLNGLFYFPPTSLLFLIIAHNLTFTFPRLDNVMTAYTFYVLENVIFLTILVIFVRRRKISVAEEKKQMNLADKVIVSHILTGKDHVGPADAAYIEHSDLTPSEKKHALELLAENPGIRMEAIREKILAKGLGLNHDFDRDGKK